MTIDPGRWLFVVGAPKCGTTALFELLAHNGNFLVPREKELHFFTREQVAASYYRAWAPASLAEYMAMFPVQGGAGSANIRCDVSPSYLYHREAIERVAREFPHSIALVMVRDPVARAFSHYQMDFQKGFVDATLLDILRAPGRFPAHYREYVECSRYRRYVDQCRELFGEGRVLVVSDKRLRENPAGVIREIEQRFGAMPGEQRQDEATANTAFIVRFAPLRRLVALPWLRAVFRLMPMSLRTRIRQLLTRPAPDARPSDEERAALENLLSPDQQWFRELLEREAGARMQPP